MNLNDFTLIIPSQNRHAYLRRILDYYAMFSFRIIIVDSTKDKLKVEMKENIEYCHVPNESLHLKLHNAVNKVKTKYTVLWGDDDFVIPESIDKCIDFLNSNYDYGSATGNEMWFFNELNTNFYPLRLNTHNLDINNELPQDRIKKLFENYTYLHYSVHRTKNLLKVYSILRDLPDTMIKYCQNFLDVISLINGKHKILPIFYGCKEISLISSSYSSRRETDNEIKPFLEMIADFLTDKSDLSSVDAKKFIWDIYYKDDQADKGIKSDILIKKKNQRITYIRTIKKVYSRLYYKFDAITKDYLKIRFRNSKLIEKSKSLEGYPFSNTDGKEELKKMRRIINRHWYNVVKSKLGI